MMRRICHQLLCGALAAACLGVAARAVADDTVIARFGPKLVTASEIIDLIPNFSPGLRQQAIGNPQVMQILLRSAYGRKLVLDEAKEKGWEKNPQVIKDVARARNDIVIHDYLEATVVPAGYPSEAEVAAFYKKQKSAFTIPAKFHLLQIVIAVPADASKEVIAAAEKRARALAAKAKAPGTDFAALAREKSEDIYSASRGGDIGWISGPQMLPPVRAAVAAIKEKGVTAPVFSDGAWRIFDVIGGTTPLLPPLADLHDRIVAMMRQQKMDDYVQHKLDTARFSVDDEAAVKLFTSIK
jgi:PPIC-type PPIASE domain